MKICIAVVLLWVSYSVNGQSLKDSLFGGKLKNPLKQAEVVNDSAKKAAIDSAAGTGVARKDAATNPSSPVTEDKPATEMQKADDNSMPDSLNKLYHAKQKAWKRFIDQQIMIINSQAEETRKVKKGEYFIEFDYEIGLNGRVKVSNITCSPHNDYLIETVTDNMTRPPVLAPPVYGDGKPRVQAAKQQMTIAKK